LKAVLLALEVAVDFGDPDIVETAFVGLRAVAPEDAAAAGEVFLFLQW
jgi:hypothetical protein